MEHEKPVKMIGVITDISGLKQKNDLLEEKVKIDAFTGLYNKEFSISSIKYILQDSPELSHALLLLDIDNFKLFNDTFGHYEGDRVIRSIAELLKNSFRKSDLLGRFGGDEFIVLVKDIPNRQWLADKIALLLDGRCDTYCITNSIGVSVYPDDGDRFDQLFTRADEALYYSKRSKRAFTFYRDLCVE